MGVSARSYGVAADVAALTKRFTNAGAYDTTTNPALAQVEGWIDQVSATLNVLLAESGFSVPVAQADCVLMLKNFVTTQVADLCNYANSAGRFFTEKGLKTGPFDAIQKEAAGFIAQHAEGMAKLGASQVTPGLDGLAFTETDDADNAIEPIFSRRQFGNRNTDWDT